jgi:hypothetical protein
MSAFAAAIGEPIAYVQEKDGELFQNVCPTRRNEYEWSNESSRAFNPYHTEAPFHPFMPSHVAFFCLRADHDGAARTLVASIRKIAPYLSVRELEILRQNVFETGIDYSFGGVTGRRGGGIVTAICYGDKSDPYFRFDPGLMKAHTADGQAVMHRLNQIIDEVVVYVRLEPGDLMIVDNRRTVHARTKFLPRYDGMDRWLQRLYITETLMPSAEDRVHNSRIIRTEFIVD